MTTGAALLDEAEKKSQKIEVHLPRSSRAFVARAERLFELLKVHRQLIQQVPGSVKETLLSSLDMIQVHVLNCERKRMEWEELIATNLSDMQSKCIKALHFSLAAIECQNTSRIEKGRNYTDSNPTSNADLETEMMLRELRAQVLTANEMAACKEKETEEINALFRRSETELHNIQLEMAIMRRSPHEQLQKSNPAIFSPYSIQDNVQSPDTNFTELLSEKVREIQALKQQLEEFNEKEHLMKSKEADLKAELENYKQQQMEVQALVQQLEESKKKDHLNVSKEADLKAELENRKQSVMEKDATISTLMSKIEQQENAKSATLSSLEIKCLSQRDEINDLKLANELLSQEQQTLVMKLGLTAKHLTDSLRQLAAVQLGSHLFVLSVHVFS